MSDNEEIGEVVKYFLEIRKPTEEDLKKKFTDDELRELCLKNKCRVDIWRWNVVDDYRTLFKKSGRYQRWSESIRLGMLAKAVNKIRPDVHKEEEIEKVREKEHKEQIKENIISLNYWKRKRQCLNNKPHEVLTESEAIGPRLIAMLGDSTDEDSGDSIESIILNENCQEGNSKEILASEEDCPQIQNMYNFNTASLTIDTELMAESNNFQAMQSEDVLSPYDNFINTMMATSTQSQRKETEEITLQEM